MKALFWIIAAALLGSGALFFSACKDDDNNSIRSKINGQNCTRFISFDVETIANTFPDESEGITDLKQLDAAEQLMLPPTAAKCRVESCIFEDGTFEGSILMLPTSGAYSYPENTAGVGIDDKALFHQATFYRDGSIFYFDENGSVVSTGFTDLETNALFAMLLDMNRMTDTLSEAHFQLVLQAFAAAGYSIDSLPDQQIITIDQPLSDGFSRVLWDKRRRALTGQEDYDMNGNLLQAYRTYLAGDFDDYKMVGHEFRTSFQSPFSDIKMNAFRRSWITNFTMQ